LTVTYRDHLAGLMQQMAWADAYIWTTVLASPVAAGDARLLATFHHLHLTQHLFRQAWTSEPIHIRDRTEFSTAADLAEFGRDANLKTQSFIKSMEPAAFDDEFREPWTGQFEARFRRPAAPHTLGESVVQVAMHTAHHRGQACTRLRDLGCQPPTVDFIVWLWAGKPAPDWACLDLQHQSGAPRQT
jgi:uncharacterized damage-inducible protein DinB